VAPWYHSIQHVYRGITYIDWGVRLLGTTSAKPVMDDTRTLVICTKNVEWGTLFAAQRVPSHHGTLWHQDGWARGDPIQSLWGFGGEALILP